MVSPRMRTLFKMAALLLVALTPGFVLWRLGVLERMTPEIVLPHLLALDGWVSTHPVPAGLAFLAGGVVLIAASLPGVALTVMTAAGFVFGAVVGAPLALCAMVLGSSVAFVLARCFSGTIAQTGIGPTLSRLAAALNTGRITPLIVARVAPGAPFWLVNVALGVMRLDPWRFLWTSAIGFAPGAVVFGLMGDGLGDQMRATGRMDVSVLTSPRVWVPFLVLTVVVMVLGVATKRRGQACG